MVYWIGQKPISPSREGCHEYTTDEHPCPSRSAATRQVGFSLPSLSLSCSLTTHLPFDRHLGIRPLAGRLETGCQLCVLPARLGPGTCSHRPGCRCLAVPGDSRSTATNIPAPFTCRASASSRESRLSCCADRRVTVPVHRTCLLVRLGRVCPRDRPHPEAHASAHASEKCRAYASSQSTGLLAGPSKTRLKRDPTCLDRLPKRPRHPDRIIRRRNSRINQNRVGSHLHRICRVRWQT